MRKIRKGVEGMFVLFIVVIAIVIANVRIVREKHCYIIERLGKYHKTWHSGIHVKIPLIDQIVMKLSLKEQVLDFPPQPVITKDNVTVQIDSVVYAYIFDPKKYTYGVENPLSGLQNLTATTLRNIIGEMELDETLTSRESINGKMQTILDRVTDPWGLKVKAVEIKNINPPREIEEAMTTQMRAERERRQAVLEAQAHQESVVTRAEGDKKARILDAEAIRESQIILARAKAEQIRIVNEAECKAAENLRAIGAVDVITKLRSIDAMKDIADGQATKIFLPSDVTASFTSAAVFGEMIQSTKPGISKRVSVTDDCCDKQMSAVTERLSKDYVEKRVDSKQMLPKSRNVNFGHEK